MTRLALLTTAAAAAAVALTACGTGGSSAVQDLLQADTYYGNAADAALAYESRPRCAHDVSGVCSIPAAVEKIREADTEAHNALQAAKAGVAEGPITDADEVAIAEAREEVFDYMALLASYGIKVEVED